MEQQLVLVSLCCAMQEPDNIDKEFLRLWFRDNCDPYNDNELPAAPPDLVEELSARYIYLYESITGLKFEAPNLGMPIHDRIVQNLKLAGIQ
jgi:phosphoribosylaminoimidazole-succinocarboxamide synthase